MKPNMYKLVSNCVDNGVNYGWNRAHKHTDSPSEAQIKDEIYNAVMNEICEWFVFHSDSED